jgi:predicted phage tail protein
VKKVILHGELGDKFQEELNLAVNSPAETMRALQANYPEIHSFLINSALDGKEYAFRSSEGIILEEEFEINNSSKEFHIVPMIEGSGFMAGTLGSIGIAWGTSYLSSWIMKRLFPNKNKDDDRTRIESNSYLYNGAENVEKQGVPIPIGYGRLRVGSKVISNALLNLDFDYETGKVVTDPFDVYRNQNLLELNIRQGKEKYKKKIKTSNEHKDNLNNELTGTGTNTRIVGDHQGVELLVGEKPKTPNDDRELYYGSKTMRNSAPVNDTLNGTNTGAEAVRKKERFNFDSGNQYDPDNPEDENLTEEEIAERFKESFKDNEYLKPPQDNGTAENIVGFSTVLTARITMSTLRNLSQIESDPLIIDNYVDGLTTKLVKSKGKSDQITLSGEINSNGNIDINFEGKFRYKANGKGDPVFAYWTAYFKYEITDYENETLESVTQGLLNMLDAGAEPETTNIWMDWSSVEKIADLENDTTISINNFAIIMPPETLIDINQDGNITDEIVENVYIGKPMGGQKGDDYYKNYTAYQTILGDNYFKSLNIQQRYDYLGLIKRFLPIDIDGIDSQIRLPLNYNVEEDEYGIENFSPKLRGQRKNFEKLESLGFYKTIDLLCEGPIGGFVDAYGNPQQLIKVQDDLIPKYTKPIIQGLSEILDVETGSFNKNNVVKLEVIKQGSSYEGLLTELVASFNTNAQSEQCSVLLTNVDNTFQGKFDSSTNALMTTGDPVTSFYPGVGYSDETTEIILLEPQKSPCVIEGIVIEEDLNESSVSYEGFGIYTINADEWAIKPNLVLRETPLNGASYFSGDTINEQTLVDNLIFEDPNPEEVLGSINLIRENLDEDFYTQLDAINTNPLEDYGSASDQDSNALNAYQIAAISGVVGDIFTITINGTEIEAEWEVGDDKAAIALKISNDINDLFEDQLISVVNVDKILILEEESGFATPPYIQVAVDNINSTIKVFDLRTDTGEALLNAKKYGAGYDYNSSLNYRIWIKGYDEDNNEKLCYVDVATKSYDDDLLESVYSGLDHSSDKPIIIGGLNGDNSGFDNTKGISLYVEAPKTKFNLRAMKIPDFQEGGDTLMNIGFNDINTTSGADYPEIKIDYSDSKDNSGIRGKISGLTSAIGIAEISKGRIASFQIDDTQDFETYSRYYPGEELIITIPYPGSSGDTNIKVDKDRDSNLINLQSDIINSDFDIEPTNPTVDINFYNGGIKSIEFSDGGSNYSESDEYLTYDDSGKLVFNNTFSGVHVFQPSPFFIEPKFKVDLDEDYKIYQVELLSPGYGYSNKFRYDLFMENPPPVSRSEISEDDYNWDNFLKGVYFNGIPVKNTTDNILEEDNSSGLYNFSLNFNMDVGSNVTDMSYPETNETIELIGGGNQKPLDYAYHNNFKTINFNSQLFGPKEEDEKVIEEDNPFDNSSNLATEDYFITHTIENQLVESIYLSLELKELYYVYEGDKEKVTINLGPIVAALIAYMLIMSSIETAIDLIPNAPLQTGASAAAAAIIAAIVFNEHIIGAFESALEALGIDNWFKVTMGEKVENSGEIWPTDIKFKIDVSNEGLDKRSMIVAFNSIATSSYVKDIKIDLPENPYNLKRIIKVSRITRESDPVVGGETEGRYHKTAFLKSITEITPSVLSYPHSVVIGSRINSKDLPEIPKREYDMRLKRIALPSNYDPETREYDGIWDGLLWGQSDVNDNIPENYLQWSDNPAWCLYDLLTNTRFGVGKYGLDHSNVDKWSLYEIGKYCDELVYSGVTPKYEFRAFDYDAVDDEYFLFFKDMEEDEFKTEFGDGAQLKGKIINILGVLNQNEKRNKIIRTIIRTDAAEKKVYISKPLPEREFNIELLKGEVTQNGDPLVIGNDTIVGYGGSQRLACVQFGHPIFEPRFSMNVLIQDKQNAVSYIKQFASFFNSVLYFDGGKIIFDQDKEKTSALGFTNSDISEKGFTYSTTRQSERPTVAVVRYNDATDDFQQKIEYIEDAEAISKFGYIEQEIDPIGVTSKGIARRTGKYMLDTFQTETETIEFETFLRGKYMKPGMVFSVVDNNRLPKKMSGRVLGINSVDKSIDVEYPLDYLIDENNEDEHLEINVVIPRESNSYLDIESNFAQDELSFNEPQIETFIVYKTSEDKETLFLKPKENLTEEEFINKIKEIPLGSSWFLDVENSQINSTKLYKALVIKEIGDTQYRIEGLEYNPNKFELEEDEKLKILVQNRGKQDRPIEVVQEEIKTDF